MERLEKLGILAIVILLVTASSVVLMSWQTQNSKEPCPVKIVNVTSNATTEQTNQTNQINTAVNTTHKKTLVFLYMTDCPYCEQMTPIIGDLTVKSYGGTFEVTHVNIDSTPGTAAQYSVASTPTIVILQNGTEVGRYVGLTDETTLLQALK